MSILKLKEAGDTAVLNITACEAVEGDYGTQIKFEADNGDTLYVPQSSVDRQMDRIGVPDYADCVGKQLRFFRAPNNKPGGKPFWNIDQARSGDTPSTNGKSPVSAGPYVEAIDGPRSERTEHFVKRIKEDVDRAQPMFAGDKLTADFELYGKIYNWYITNIVPKSGEVGCSPESVAAGVATIYINATKRGA